MEQHAGKYRLEARRGQVAAEGDCRVALSDDGLLIAPAAGAAFALYYSDIDRVGAADWQIALELFDGRVVTVYFLGTWYGQCVKELMDRRSAQLTRNLLMLDAGFEKAFRGACEFTGPDGVVRSDADCRIALYRSSLVVEPAAGDFFTVAYADIESMAFDPVCYGLELRLDLGERVLFGMLGTRFGELEQEIRRLTALLYDRTAAYLKEWLPEARETAIRELAVTLRQGKAVPKPAVLAAAPGLWPPLEALMFTPGSGEPGSGEPGSGEPGSGEPGSGEPGAGEAGAAGPDPLRRACFAHLCSLARPEHIYVGFRESWEAEGQPVYWFVVAFPEQGRLAVEVTNEPGNATYIYRLEGPADRAVRELSRAMVAVNFRRDVISASEAELAGERMARYRVAVRKLPYVQRLRALFAGKAAHTSEAAWQRKVSELLGR
ncbi:MAG TPA: hypothetical protein VGK74_11370 [Symbiobacteriaceae bacterium]|jgi:hypothetical protein